MSDLRTALERLIDFERHAPDCPAAEWSGTRPDCDCEWDELEAEARAALADTQDGAVDLDAAAVAEALTVALAWFDAESPRWSYPVTGHQQKAQWLVDWISVHRSQVLSGATPPPQPGEPE